jgi:hypothetical protein
MRLVNTFPIALCIAGAACAPTGPAGTTRTGSVEAASQDRHDRVYLAMRLRDEGCRPQVRARCCPLIKDRLDRARAANELATVATTLTTLAVACPDMRDFALEAMEHRSTRASTPDDGLVKVSYAAHVGPADRVYWASAFVDGKQLAGTALPPGPHVLDIEIHVMSASGSDSDALFRIKAQKELILEPKATRRFLASLRRKEGAPASDPFTLELLENRAPEPTNRLSIPPEEPSSPQPAASTPAPAGTLTPAGGPTPPEAPPTEAEVAAAIQTVGRHKTFPRPRLPSELRRDRPWATMLHVCVNTQGRVQSMTPMIDPPHPRMLGVLLDTLAHTEYLIFTMRGRPLPFCYPLSITISPG